MKTFAGEVIAQRKINLNFSGKLTSLVTESSETEQKQLRN